MPATLYVLAPSFFCLVINGILLFILLLMVIFNFRSFIKTDYIKLLPIIGTVAIAIGSGLTLIIELTGNPTQESKVGVIE